MDIKAVACAILHGCLDSIKGMYAVVHIDRETNIRNSMRQSPTRANSIVRQKNSRDAQVRSLKKHEESNVTRRIIQCGILNGGIFLLSILLFEYGLLPCISKLLGLIFGSESFKGKFIWSWIEPILSIIFKTVWVIPLFLLSKIVNGLWFQDIATLAYRHSYGRVVSAQSFSKAFADFIFSIVIQVLFLIQATAASYIPIPIMGHVLSVVQMCLLYSLYAFEYKWSYMGWELHQRLNFIEVNWPYFIGFGLPLTLFTQMWNSWIISGCIFSLLFPFYLISGNEASPILNACDVPLHFFSPVICISNFLFSKTMKMTKKTTMTAASNAALTTYSAELSS